MELENINLKVQRICANTGEVSSSVSFHQYFQVLASISFELQNLFSTFGVVRNDFSR